MCNYLSELPEGLVELGNPTSADGVMHKEASTITDIHNSSDNTEVHLISLVTEQIPKYRLRSDSPTGYDQQDWLQTPLISPGDYIELSPELYQQTFEYFMISSNRLSQMTRTYHDIEAVTSLLEEKEHDLELAARIGQTLLQKNRDAQLYSQKLEDDLAYALEQVSQLKHEIALKDNLLHTYANDESDSSGAPSPIKEFRKLGSSGMVGHLDDLQTRIKRLEVDNGQLRHDKVQYEQESEELETHEHDLMSDALKEMEGLRKELKNARHCNSFVSEELTQKAEETVKLQEEVTRLLTQIVDMQRKHKQVALENEELQQHLFAANSAQVELTQEIQILEEQYEELSIALNESREEARTLRDSQPDEDMAKPIPFSDSLAAELELDSKALFSETVVKSNELHKGKAANQSNYLSTSDQEVTSKSPSQRAFDTVKFVNRFQASGKPFSTPIRQNRPIPTPFPLLSSPGSTISASRFNSTGPDSGCLMSTPNQQVGNRPCLDPQLTRNSQKHDVMNPKFASSVLSPYVKLSTRMHVISPIGLRHMGNAGIQSQSVDGHQPFEEAGLLSRKFWGARHQGSCVGRSTPNLGRPGIPGTEDLEKAIRKLALRRESLRYIQWQRYHSQSVNAQSSKNEYVRSGASSSQSYSTNYIASSPSRDLSSDQGQSEMKRSPKLRIVKPLEGSVTLNQWKYLAGKDRTLQLSKETKCGVMTRDKIVKAHSRFLKSNTKTASSQTTNFAPLNLQPNSSVTGSCTLDKILENTRRVNKMIRPNKAVATCENPPSVSVDPGKNFAFTRTKYTFAYSSVKNPNDEYETVSSNFTSVPKMSPAAYSSPQSVNDSVQNQSFTNLVTPNSAIMPNDITRTCSTEMGIAKLLKERDVKPVEEVNSANDHYKDDDLTSHLKSGKGKNKSAAPLASTFRMNFPGPLVWNRTLRRSFLLSANLVGQKFISRNDRASVSTKPETPPNSPTHEFEEQFTFLDDGYLSPEPDQKVQPSVEMHSWGMPKGAAAAAGSCLEDECQELGSDVSACTTAMQQSGEGNSQNLDWSQLHGSSGALCEPCRYDELEPSSE